MSAAEVHHNLKVMAERLTQESHYLEAVKCYTAILNQSLLPTDEATARLRLAHLLLEHTCNVADARVQLQKAVSYRAATRPTQHMVAAVFMSSCTPRCICVLS